MASDKLGLMKPLFLLASIVVLSSLKAHAQDAPLKVSQVATRGAKVNAFVPSGWKLEKLVSGDLNRDNVPDAALVLVRNTKAKDANGYATARPRALVVALKNGRSWRRVGINNSLLMGTRDGGAFWGMMETPVDVTIRKGVLLIQQESGSRETTDTTHRFRYDARKGGLFLIGFDMVNGDRATGESRNVSSNFLTGTSIIQTMKSGTSPVVTKRTRVSTKLRSLESVSVDERYSG